MPKRASSDLDTTALQKLLREQDGVVSRSQLVDLGASRNDVRRLLSRAELVTVHPRVYVNHSGRLTRRQREWAAVLACAPAALHRESALDAHGMTRDRPPQASRDQPIHLLVDRQRRIVPPPGITIERVADRATWIQANRRPPRAVFDYALLKAAGDRGEADAIALLSDAVHQGLTTSPRLLEAIAKLPRLPRRAMLSEVLADVQAGPDPSSSSATSATSKGRTGCRPENASSARRRSAAPYAGTSGTPPSEHSSSSTAPSVIAMPSIGGQISSATSTQRWRTTSRCDPAGPRSWSRAGLPGSSRPSFATADGRAGHARAASTAVLNDSGAHGPT